MSDYITTNILPEIQKRFEAIGFDSEVNTEIITVHSPDETIAIGNKIMILNNRDLPLFDEATLRIESASNVFTGSKSFYQSQNWSRFQVFEGGTMRVRCNNSAVVDDENNPIPFEFRPFRLEFVTVKPKPKRS